MKLAILLLCASLLAFGEDPKPLLCNGQPCVAGGVDPAVQAELAAKDATIQKQQHLIQALQAKLAALLQYMQADENIRALQQPEPAKP